MTDGCTVRGNPQIPQHCPALQILTKGDNNFADDYAGNLYAEGQRWLANKHIMGRVVG